MKGRELMALLVVALLSGVALVFGALDDPGRAVRAYLVGYLYWLTLSLGLLCLVLIAHAARAKWMALIRRFFELAGGSLWMLAVLFVPVFLGREHLYFWAQAAGSVPAELHEVMQHRASYMTAVGWAVRAAVYFLIWIGLAEWLLRLARQRDATPSPVLTRRLHRVAAAGLPFFALSLTAMSFDWVMALEPRFASTMFGVYLFAGAFVSALALAIIVVRRAERGGTLQDLVRPAHYGALGRLLFAFIVFWAYIAYCQFFIVYMGDMPEEVPFYAARLLPGWLEVSVVLVLMHWVVPFFVLLPRDIKRRGPHLAAVAIWVLAAHALDVFWLVMPGFGPPSLHWLDVAALVFVGAVTGLAGAFRARRIALISKHDPDLEASLAYQGT